MRAKSNSHPQRPERSSGFSANGHRQSHAALRWLLGLVTAFAFVKAFARRPPSGSPAPSQPAPPATHPQGPVASAAGHELRDVQVGWIFGIVLFLAISGIAIHLVLAGMLNGLKREPPAVDRWRPSEQAGRAAISRPAFPRLQVSPAADLQAFRAREDAELNTYGWINKTAGAVRIPIERAMELVLEKGLPARSGTNGDRLGRSSYELLQQRPLHRESEIQARP